MSTTEEQDQRWKEHFEEVLNQPEPTAAIEVEDQPLFELEINCNDIKANEITKAINSLKTTKP